MATDKEKEIKAFRDAMWIFWAGTAGGTPPCIRCSAPAVTLHEPIPRSIDPEWFEKGPIACVPVCQKCHDWAHSNSWEVTSIIFRERATIKLQIIGEWKPDRVVQEFEREEEDETTK